MKMDADGKAAGDRSRAAMRAAPKPKSKEEKVVSATMEEVCERLADAFQNVAANRGAPGPDRQSIEQVREHLDETLHRLRADLLASSYRPGEIRRVWIPKASGGQRRRPTRREAFRRIPSAARAA
jgi:retron-type reverse transcriptase